MTVETILIVGFTILTGLVGFFLQAFYKQVQRVVENVEDIRVKQAENAEKLNGFERRLQIIEGQIFLKQAQQQHAT